MNPNYLNVVLSSILPLVGSICVAVITFLLNNLRRKVKLANGVKAQEALDKVIREVVISLNETIVGDIKRAKRKLKASDMGNIKAKAVENTHYIAANSVLSDVTAVVDDVDGYISANIESQIAEQKKVIRYDV